MVVILEVDIVGAQGAVIVLVHENKKLMLWTRQNLVCPTILGDVYFSSHTPLRILIASLPIYETAFIQLSQQSFMLN